MAAYTKEFLIEVYLARFEDSVDTDAIDRLYSGASALYDRVGRDSFRKYASVTPAMIRHYKAGKTGFELYMSESIEN